MIIPNFLRNLLQSNNYWNKNSAEFAKANEYLEKLFPGELQRNANGQYIEPKYDMTYEQFINAQKKLDEAIQDAIQDAEAEAEEKGMSVDYSQFVEAEEEIDVRVLMPLGDIENKTDTKEVKDMEISNKGISWLKGKEDKVLDRQGNHIIYDDKTGKPVNTNEPLPRGATIGYGHLIKSDEDFRNGINETTATELLRTDITTAEHAVKNNISVQLKQNQYDALVSLAYNIGAKNFANSTVVKYINNPNFHSSVYPNLESAWKAWNRSQGEISNGLINRRQNEWDLYNRGIY